MKDCSPGIVHDAVPVKSLMEDSNIAVYVTLLANYSETGFKDCQI